MEMGVHSIFEIAQQLLDDGGDVILVADQIQQVQGSLPDGHIRVVQIYKDLFEMISKVMPHCQSAHRLQPQISEISPGTADEHN